MTFDDVDSPLTPEEEARVRSLTPAELERIDQALLSHISDKWQKVARVIGQTMLMLEREFPHLPDRSYSVRVKHLAASRAIEAAGNLNRIRHSEIRLPQKPADSE